MDAGSIVAIIVVSLVGGFFLCRAFGYTFDNFQDYVVAILSGVFLGSFAMIFALICDGFLTT
ncbi:hypothetical protein [Bacillus safensis]|uniref:hypothetical protein n=1 Tax=Bacillus safensis TaxID=561879 RepID=UPI002FFE9B2B